MPWNASVGYGLVFRGKLIYYMKQEKLDFCKEIEELKISQEFDKFISSLYSKDWVVYCKPPFKNANSVIEYLGRYIGEGVSMSILLKFYRNFNLKIDIFRKV